MEGEAEIAVELLPEAGQEIAFGIQAGDFELVLGRQQAGVLGGNAAAQVSVAECTDSGDAPAEALGQGVILVSGEMGAALGDQFVERGDRPGFARQRARQRGNPFRSQRLFFFSASLLY